MAERDANSAGSSLEDQQQNKSEIDELKIRIRPALPYQDEPVTFLDNLFLDRMI